MTARTMIKGTPTPIAVPIAILVPPLRLLLEDVDFAGVVVVEPGDIAVELPPVEVDSTDVVDSA